MLLFVPRRWVFGYKCIDQNGIVRKVDAELMRQVKSDALDFFYALPPRRLKGRELLLFAIANMPWSAAFAVILTAFFASLIGMFVPFINKEIFNNVIPNGIMSDLYPVAALFGGVVVGCAMMEVMRNKLVIRVKDVLSVTLQHAVMARIFTLDTSFFWKYSSGEITNRVTSIRQLCDLANNAILGAVITLMFSMVYVLQIFFYAKDLMLVSMLLLFVQVSLLVVYAVQMHNEERELIEHKAMLDGMEYNIFSGIQKIKLTGSETRAYTKWLNLYRHCAHISYNPSVVV